MDHDNGCDKLKKFSGINICPVKICDDITVKVPITVRARADVDEVEFECKGHTLVKEMREKHCNSDKFTLIQKIQVRIPIKFDAECDVCEGTVDFDVHECNA